MDRSLPLSAEKVIDLLDLRHLGGEGGYYAETYRSQALIPAEALPARYHGKRTHGTAIYFLLTAETFSAIHRLKSDEVFHFYAGDPVEMLVLGPKANGRRIMLGADLRKGQRPQVIVPRGVWQGARLAKGGKWVLLGTTVAPGFEREDFELGDRSALWQRYPRWRSMITALSRGRCALEVVHNIHDEKKP